MGTRRMPGQIVLASPAYGTFPDIYVDVRVSFGYNGDSNPADTEFTKIWANGSLIWRAGTELLPDIGSITTYTGTDNQAVNSLYSASVGSTNATAFRGQMLAFFRGLPLENFNYMMPGISAEISGTITETPPDDPTWYARITAFNTLGAGTSGSNQMHAALITGVDASVDGWYWTLDDNGPGANDYFSGGP